MTEEYCYPTDQYVLLGKIAKAHGLRGEVKIFSYSGQPENFQDYKEIVLVDTSGKLSRPLEVTKIRIQGKMAIAQISEVNSRNRAEEIIGLGVLISKNRLPDVAEGEYYWFQYEGKLVIDLEGQTIGRVTNLFNNGAQDILVVDSGSQEILIPVTRNIVVQETAEALIVDPPPGLLELMLETDDSGHRKPGHDF